jgi:hypothetical protein
VNIFQLFFLSFVSRETKTGFGFNVLYVISSSGGVGLIQKYRCFQEEYDVIVVGAGHADPKLRLQFRF